MTNSIKEKLPFYFSIAAIVFLFFVVEYSLISKDFFALSADESGHTLESYEWYNGSGQLFSIWLPFYKVVNGIALHLHYDLLVTPRVLSAVFGLLTIFALIFLTYQLFENKIIALLTGFFATIFLPVPVFSILPLTEIYFFFFIVSSIGCFLRWLKNGHGFYLWLTVFLLCISTTIRYEAWVFAVFMLTQIILQIYKSEKTASEKITMTAAIIIILLAFPLYWVYLSILTNATAHGFVSAVTNRYNEGEIFGEIKNNTLFIFLIVNVISLNIIGIASLLYLTGINPHVKKYFIIFFGTLITFSFLSFIIKALPTHNHWRVAMIWSLLLLPFTAYWLNNLLESSNSIPINRYGFFILFIVVIYFFNRQLIEHTSSSYLTKEDINIGYYINKILHEEKLKFYVMKDASDKWKYSNFLITSQLPDKFVIELNNFKYISNDTILVDSKLISEMKDRKIRYVLVPYKTFITNSSMYFDEIEVFEHWKILKINAPS